MILISIVLAARVSECEVIRSLPRIPPHVDSALCVRSIYVNSELASTYPLATCSVIN